MLGTLARVVFSSLSLLVVGLVVPGFKLGGLYGALLTALFIALLTGVIRKIFGGQTPRGRGLTGFISSFLVINAVQLAATGGGVSLPGGIMAALLIGIVDGLAPVELR